jgi:hypothetical protein
VLLRGLGEGLAVTGVSLKPYCSAKQIQSAVAAFSAALDEQ